MYFSEELNEYNSKKANNLPKKVIFHERHENHENSFCFFPDFRVFRGQLRKKRA